MTDDICEDHETIKPYCDKWSLEQNLIFNKQRDILRNTAIAELKSEGKIASNYSKTKIEEIDIKIQRKLNFKETGKYE